MTLFEQIQDDLKTALKAKMMERVQALRLLISVFRNREIEKRGKGDSLPLTSEEAVLALKTEAKKRKEAIDFFVKGNREEQAAKEKFELAIIESYLPAQMSEEEVSRLVQTVIAELKPSGAKDFGRIMKELILRSQGKADASLMSVILKRVLADQDS